jgi:hypothetical protein
MTMSKSKTTSAPAPRRGGNSAKRKPSGDDQAASKADKSKKRKLVRDSFTMPEDEYQLIAELKRRCLGEGLAVKKSEILRAAVVRLAQSSDAFVVRTVRQLPAVKTGRPAKTTP